MMDLWREWITENPFLQRDLRRWSRRGYAWKIPLACVGFPALLMLGLLALFLAAPPFIRQLMDRPFGLLLFTVVSFAHLAACATFWSAGLSLATEAATDRLSFLQLLPIGGRELVAKINVARALLRAAPAVAAAPLYVLLLSYGSVHPEDIVFFYALLAFLLFASPGVSEVSAALARAEKEDAASVRMKPSAGGWIVLALFQVGIQAFSSLIKPFFMPLFRRMVAALGPEFRSLLPFHPLVAAERFLWLPQPFYQWVLPLFGLLLLCWVLRRVRSVTQAGERWDRGLHVEKPGDEAASAAGEQGNRQRTSAARRALETLPSAVFSWTVIGLLWQPLIVNGALGSVLRQPTASGSVAALLVIPALLTVLVRFERLRGDSSDPSGSSALALFRGACVALVTPIMRIAMIVAAASAVGGVAPSLKGAGVLAALLPLVVSAYVFALGWRALLVRKPGTWTLPSAWLVGLLWLFSYALPLLVLLRPALPQAWHAVAACSPVHALLRLLPGLWPGSSPLPGQVSFLLPGVVGVLLLAVATRRGSALVPAETVPANRDPVLAYAQRQADRWSNPVFSLAVRRLLRSPTRLMLWGIMAPVLLIVVPPGALWIMSLGIGAGKGFSIVQEFARPVGKSGLLMGGVLGLVFAGILLLLPGLSCGLALMSSISTEKTEGEKQLRLPDLLISPLPDRQIVLGFLSAALLSVSPWIIAGVVASLFWSLVSLAYGTAWW
ncbi:MAG TPA: hypothetical protein VK689_19150, partial [Armatimonadota bacterium]|nr:hypothetical protein [Armatimonadota bacterium]